MNEIEEKGFELKYAPRKCKHFCCGDCSISGRTCMTDFPDCRAAEPKNAEKYKLEDYIRDNPELAKEVEKEMKKQAITNYDKIRNMTVEEMAVQLTALAIKTSENLYKVIDVKMPKLSSEVQIDVFNIFKEWLESEE